LTIEIDPKADPVPQVWNSPELAVIVPTFNERDNVVSLFDLVSKAMGDIPFEFIVVDVVRQMNEPRVRCADLSRTSDRFIDREVSRMRW